MTAAPKPAPDGRHRGRLPVAPMIAAALLLLAGCGQGPQPSATGPAASPPPAASADDVGIVPAALSLGARGGRATVQPVATAPDGELAVPADPQLLGWWVGGARVAAPAGTAVLAGHVDSAEAGIGFFAALRDAEVGEQVVVHAADGSERRFVVSEIRQVGKNRLPRSLFTRQGPPRLAMITCTGEFDDERRSYADNLVVLAAPG
jgi:hypothetical protein